MAAGLNLSAHMALERLKAGNEKFVARTRGERAGTILKTPLELAGGQRPFAVILGCSDSRVPVEIVFHQGLGALFVIRVAGNIVAPSQVGSVEFAATRLGVRLVVVLGHSGCGLVTATLDEFQNKKVQPSPNLRTIVERVLPAVKSVVSAGPGRDRDTLIDLAVQANVRASVNHLRYGSEILEEMTMEHGLQIVGAEYRLETGVVEFFEDLA